MSGYKDAAPVAEGVLRDSIEHDVTANGSIVTLRISAAPHARYVETGRKRGKFPPLDAIKQWCIAKGIETGAAFPIARAIAKRGITPKHVLRGVIDRRQPLIEQIVKRAFGDAVKLEGQNMLKRFVEKKG